MVNNFYFKYYRVIIAKPDNYMAGVAAPASLGFPLSYHRRVVATKSTTSYNYPGNAQLLYDNNSIFIHFCKVPHYFSNVGQIAILPNISILSN